MQKHSCSIKGIILQLLSYKKEVIFGNMIAILATLLVVLIPLFIPLLVDELLLDKQHGFIEWISQNLFTSDIKGYVLFVLVLILVLRVLSTLLSIYQTKIFVSISKNITYQMRASLIEHLKFVSLKEYEMMRVGAVTSKLVTDVETIDSFVSTTISKLIVAVLMIFFSAIVLLFIHWQLAIFILITNPVVILFTVKLARNIGDLKKEENKAVELFQASITETLELFHQIRAANKEVYFFEQSRLKADELRTHAVNYGYKSDRALKYSYLVFLAGYEIFRAVQIFLGQFHQMRGFIVGIVEDDKPLIPVLLLDLLHPFQEGQKCPVFRLRGIVFSREELGLSFFHLTFAGRFINHDTEQIFQG